MINHINRAYSSRETLNNTFEYAKKCCDVKGVFVECGVAAGSQVAAMGLACPDKTLYLFDSFEGIPFAGEHDGQQPGMSEKPTNPGELKSSGISVHSKKQVAQHLKEWGVKNKKVYIEGWFQNTIPKTKIKSIALLRLDGDLYESTKICLEYLYPKLTKGGYLIIDDYVLRGCKKAVDDYLGCFKAETKDRVLYIQKWD